MKIYVKLENGRILYCTGDPAWSRLIDNGLYAIKMKNTVHCKKNNNCTVKKSVRP